MNEDKQLTQFWYFSLAVLCIALAAAIGGCSMPTEGFPCSTDGCETSSEDGGTLPETLTPTSVASASTSATGEPDVTTGTSAGPMTTDARSESTGGEESTDGGLSEDSSSDGSDGSSTSDESTGDAPWPNYDAAHCDAACPALDKQTGAAVDACICAPACENSDECDAPAECLGGRCAIPCGGDYLCEWNTTPEFVCGSMMNGHHACMYSGEGP